jgi:hypothetical protein
MTRKLAHCHLISIDYYLLLLTCKKTLIGINKTDLASRLPLPYIGRSYLKQKLIWVTVYSIYHVHSLIFSQDYYLIFIRHPSYFIIARR